jgi:elongation factor P--(R)-beta-lysine ligase
MNNNSINSLITLISLLKDFFDSKNFTSVNTPIVINSPLPEPHIDALLADNGGYYRTSPELNMKIILSESKKNIYEIGPCFRKDEIGKIHKEKFTMLEWYEVGANYIDLIDFTKEMLIFLAKKLFNSTTIEFNNRLINFDSDWEIFTIEELFAKFTQTSPIKALKCGKFEELLAFNIEPNLPKDRVVIVKDFPAELAALAKLKVRDRGIAERWELYLGGIEIANTYTELTDKNEHLQRFAKFANIREKIAAPEYPVDPRFLSALDRGIPDSAGCALGVDRLNMILNDDDSI